MQIKTKFDIGDAVYLLDGYKIRRANIVGVFFQQIGEAPCSIQYKFAVFPTRKESEVFKTKEEYSLDDILGEIFIRFPNGLTPDIRNIEKIISKYAFKSGNIWNKKKG